MKFERERATQTQYSIQQKYEKEKLELTASTNKTLKQMEERMNDLEIQNKELTEKRYKNDAYIQELEYRNKTLQEDLTQTKSELSRFKKENSTLDMRLHEEEKQIGQLTNRVSVLEMEIKEKNELVRKLQESAFNDQNQIRQLDENLKDKIARLKEKQVYKNYFHIFSNFFSNFRINLNLLKLRLRLFTTKRSSIKET